MVLRKKNYPEIGEYVIATATRLEGHGVYVNLDEFDKGGYIPIGEVASTWVKNIKDFVKEGQKVVLKVIRIDDRKGHIDLSLRKVTEREKKEKLIQYKKGKKAEKLLENAAKSLNVTFPDAVKTIGIPLEDYFGDLYGALEAATVKGPKALVEAGIPEEWGNALFESSKGHIEAPTVHVTNVIKIQSQKPKGVEDIKAAIIAGVKAAANKDVKVDVTYLGAPKYRMEISAKDYKTAEEAMKKAADTIVSKITAAGGSSEFAR